MDYKAAAKASAAKKLGSMGIRPKYADGGRANKSTTVNIIIPQASPAMQPPMAGPPVPIPAPPSPMPPPPNPLEALAAAAGQQGGPPGGAMPPMRNGGRAGFAKGGVVGPEPKVVGAKPTVKGKKVGMQLDVGAGGGEGRLDKTRAYGLKGRKGR